MHQAVAPTIVELAEAALAAPMPVRVRGWDGSEAGASDPEAPTVVIRSPRAVRYLVGEPNELGLGRAFVAGELEVEGDLELTLRALTAVISPPDGKIHRPAGIGRRRLFHAARALDAIGKVPPPPPEEVPKLSGRRHSKHRDRAAISHHYNVGNEFYRLVLGPSMVYSCAFWDRGEGGTLEQAQAAKLDLVCRKLDLREGDRLLDVGCGWGSMALHAAAECGARVVGVTISTEQAALARERVEQAGLADRVEIRVQDYRDVDDGPFDAISSIGMAEHVGHDQFATYAAQLHRLLRPGGRLLNHQIAGRPGEHAQSAFMQAYVFPDGELRPVGDTVLAIEEAGFEVRDVEALREHYAHTLRAWVENLRENWDEAVALTSAGRARVWWIYMTGSALAFEANRIGVNQILAVRPFDDGRSTFPPTRAALLGDR